MKKSKEEILKMVTSEMIQGANDVCVAQAWVQTVKPIVEGYQKEILGRHQFTNKGEQERLKNSKRGPIAERVILNPKDSFLLSDVDFEVYHNECKKARDLANLKVENDEQCPLLVAEWNEIKAKREFIDAMTPITGFTADQATYSLEYFKKAVDLCLGLVASLGLLENKFERKL